MPIENDLDHAGSEDRAQGRREAAAREILLHKGAGAIDKRPWQHSRAPLPAGDLTQYALWRSSELSPDELLGALTLLPAARAEVEGVEAGLFFAARHAGLTWAQIAEAMGFRSPQACQQYASRLGDREAKRS